MNHSEDFMTLPFLGYLLACIVAGFVLTMVVSLFRSTKRVDEFKSGYWIAAFSVLAGLAPYGYSEYLTKKHGTGMEKAVKEALTDAGIADLRKNFSYFKVLRGGEKEASIVAVANEKGTFGEPERTVVLVQLKKGAKGWNPVTFEFINSYKRQKDAATFPPYW